MTKKEILEMTGLSEEEFYQQYPTQESWTESYKKGGWIQKATASIKRRGTEGVCTGSNFGGPSCRPGTKRYNLAKTFRKMAKSRKEDGGIVDMYKDGGKLPEGVLRARLESHMSPSEAQSYINSYAKGGVVDVYQLMGMPTPSMYGMGGPTHYIPSYNFGHVQSKNTTYNHGYANGGLIPMYDFGSTVADIGKLGLNTLAAPIEQVSGNNFVNFNYANKGMANAAAVSEGVLGAATDIVGTGVAGPAYGMAKGQIQGVTKNLGNSEEYQRGADKWANKTGQIVGSTGDLVAGIASGNPQQIVGGAGNILGTAGGELGSKELGTLGQLTSLSSSFVNPGNAGSMNKTSNLGGGSNIATATGGMPMFAAMGGPVYNPFLTPQMQLAQRSAINKGTTMAAMGGAVNAPNMMQYADGGLLGNMPIFADGGQPEVIMGNVEKGELLLSGVNFDPMKLGRTEKLTTEYSAKNLPLHPADGSQDPRGNVPLNKGQFIIKRKYAKVYKDAEKTNDHIAKAMAINNTQFEKTQIEMKEKAAQEIAQQKASKAMNRMMAKYGGAIQRMYAKGGLIPMYNNGAGVTGGLNINNPAFNNNYSFDPLNNAFSGSMYFSNTPSNLNLDSSPMTMAEYRGQTGSYMNPANIPDTGITGYKGSDASTPPPNKFNTKDFMSQAIPYGVAASQVLEPLLQRPYSMDASKYETPADLKWRELTGERGRRDMQGAYNAAKYNARQIGASLPALTSTASRYFDSLAAYNEALENKNRMGQSEIDRANKAIQQNALAQRFQIDQFNQQNIDARQNAIRQGLMNVAGTYYNQQANQMTKEGLTAAYPDYQFPWNKKTKV